MERVIDWQGSSYVFCGDRPTNPRECFNHYTIVMGVSATLWSRDHRGNSTARPRVTRRNIVTPMTQRKCRKLRFMSTYIELMSVQSMKHSGPSWIDTRAAKEPLVMLELLVKKHLENDAETTEKRSTTRKNSAMKVQPLSMISIFKDHLKAEERVFRFDILALNQRCVELMRKFQRACIEKSPLDYPLEEYGTGQRIGKCYTHMLAGVMGEKRQQPTRFNEACLFVKDLISTNGEDEEYEKSISRCFIQDDGNKHVIDSFSTPDEDNLSPFLRSLASKMKIANGRPSGNGGCTIL